MLLLFPMYLANGYHIGRSEDNNSGYLSVVD